MAAGGTTVMTKLALEPASIASLDEDATNATSPDPSTENSTATVTPVTAADPALATTPWAVTTTPDVARSPSPGVLPLLVILVGSVTLAWTHDKSGGRKTVEVCTSRWQRP